MLFGHRQSGVDAFDQFELVDEAGNQAMVAESFNPDLSRFNAGC